MQYVAIWFVADYTDYVRKCKETDEVDSATTES